jgi:hypothetical protein
MIIKPKVIRVICCEISSSQDLTAVSMKMTTAFWDVTPWAIIALMMEAV